MHARRAVLVVLVCLLVATPVAAHVPAFPEDNTSPERAVSVPVTDKSWSFYDSLERGQATYYRASLDAGERLRVGTFTPDGGEFTPSIVLLSESLNGTDEVPAGVTVPAGMNATVVEGERPVAASYEPFAPAAYYHTAELDRTVPDGGTYIVAIYEPANRSGEAGVALGYGERFSPVEYVTVPFDLVRVHRWENQHPLFVFGPWLVTFVLGSAFVASRREEWARAGSRQRDTEGLLHRTHVTRLVLSGGALLVLATAAGTTLQMVVALGKTGPALAAIVTAVFVAVPVVCGGWALQVAVRDPLVLGDRTRIGLSVAAIASLATWAGFLVGPAILAAVAVLAPWLRES
jgi:hypothetical protein